MVEATDYAHPYTASPGIDVDRLRLPALVTGVAGLVLCAVGFFVDREQFFQSYLFGYLFWLGLPLGAMAILMLQHLTGGAWGLILRRPLEAATRTLPLLVLFFIPIYLGKEVLYPWMHGTEDFKGFKDWWLQTDRFTLFTILYFAIWLIWMVMLNAWSNRQDKVSDPRLIRRLQFISGPGLVLYFLTATGAAVDWVMSIDAHWFSTMYGFWFIIGQGLTALAFLVWLVCQLASREPLAPVIKPTHYTDFGNLLFAFNMLWAYISFSQFLIIWSGNIAEETPYYYIRTQEGGWACMALVLVIFHFAIPFVLLLNRALKRSVKALAAVALWMVLMRFVDYYWTLMPTFAAGHDGPSKTVPPIHLSWQDFAAPIGIGGIWLAVFLWQLSRRPLIAPNDPRLDELKEHHG